jgi:PAS domain S-box-containing protein
MAAAWVGGLGPALAATVLSAVAANYVFLPPAFAFGLTPTTVLLLGVFMAVSVFICAVHNALRRERMRFAVTLASIGDAVIATDPRGRVTFLNPVAEALTGWRARDAAGRDLAEVLRIVHLETREPVESPVATVLREGAVVGLANHTVLLARDGTEHPIADSSAPIRDADGTLLGVVLVFRDVTERARAEQALCASETRFRTLTSLAPVGIFLTDAVGDCLFVNERWREMAGLSPDEAMGQGWARALHPEDRARVFEEWYRAARTGDEFSRDYRFQTPAGTVTWLHGTAVELRRHGGRSRAISAPSPTSPRRSSAKRSARRPCARKRSSSRKSTTG